MAFEYGPLVGHLVRKCKHRRFSYSKFGYEDIARNLLDPSFEFRDINLQELNNREFNKRVLSQRKCDFVARKFASRNLNGHFLYGCF